MTDPLGACAFGRLPRTEQPAHLHHLDRVGCLVAALRRTSPSRAARSARVSRGCALLGLDAGLHPVPHPCAGHNLCFELASLLVERFGGASAVVDEVHGFKFFEERELLGFVDGTERKIVPDNLPFGRVGQAEFGTYFIGYAKTPPIPPLP